MDHRKFSLKLLIILFSVALLAFWAEAAWEFSRAVHPETGAALTLEDLEVTAAMVRTVASPFARAYNNILALLLTFISLAIPLTANLYTPKLIEIFIRDRINLVVLSSFSILAAHSLLAISLSFDQWTPELPFWIGGIGAVFGWLVLMPYYYYVLGFLDPITIIQRVHRSLVVELRDVARGKVPVTQAQKNVNQRIVNLGSVLQRSVDRADRDVTVDAIRAHMHELARMRRTKDELPPGFFQVNNELLVGMSSDATANLSRERIWMEHRVLSQLVLAFRIALTKMPDAISPLVHAVKQAAVDEAANNNDAVFALLVRTLNTFLRESVLRKDNAACYYVIYNYKTLVRRLLASASTRAPELVRYLRYYAELARAQGMGFTHDLISYELAELTEVAYEREAPCRTTLLQAVLDFEGVERSAGLVKSRAMLAGFFLAAGYEFELARLIESLRETPEALLRSARETLLQTESPVFWELTDRGTNIDYVVPERRASLVAVFERLGV